ncbi:MAG: MerR family transcriptional regulator [Dehalococcoidia bacterium]|nr:MerR family transcriptional regulator [Dehalococcoidia bacterium]
MNVSQLARSAGLSPSGVRWYETVGVLPAASRNQNGYREYSDQDLRLLQLVTTLRRVGLTPSDAGRLARLCLEHGAADPVVSSVLAEHRQAVSRRREELGRLEAELGDLEATIAETRPDPKTPRSGAQGPISTLFLCNGNSGRSQIAEALLRRYGGTDFDARSAGITPRGISPMAVRALAEGGIDWSGARSKCVDELAHLTFDYVITLSDAAREQCPELPGPHNSLHWRLEDPADVPGTEEVRLQAYRRTVDELMLRLRPFAELAAHAAGRTSTFRTRLN